MNPQCLRCRKSTAIAGSARWLLPGMIIVLMPKCPACFAGYIMLVSGIGLSVATADSLRTALILLCAALLACLAIAKLRRATRRRV